MAAIAARALLVVTFRDRHCSSLLLKLRQQCFKVGVVAMGYVQIRLNALRVFAFSLQGGGIFADVLGRLARKCNGRRHVAAR